jgi:hypothetical protein
MRTHQLPRSGSEEEPNVVGPETTVRSLASLAHHGRHRCRGWSCRVLRRRLEAVLHLRVGLLGNCVHSRRRLPAEEKNRSKLMYIN